MVEERRCRFVQGEITRITLSGGEWIDIKSELNAGEARRVFSSLIKEMNAGERMKLDPDRVGLTKLLGYLVGWSLLNSEGRPEPLDESAIDNLDRDTYAEIVEAVEAHDRACDERRAARKNDRDGETRSSAISPSRGAAAGESSGSAS
jgi:hypothetical protein